MSRFRIEPPALLCLLALVLAGCGREGAEVGEFKNDLLGNEIKIDALADPKVPGVVCHFSHFDRGFWDRIGKGNWFEDPSNASISCLRTGPIDLSAASLRKAGEEVFSQRQSLFFKAVAVRRIVDLDNRALLYVVHSRELVEGSAKMSLSTISLTGEEVAALAAE
ncbi:MAG: CreA family protein [Alphaproteobacteria bacterium]|nr:CreA family protein [Alphaproteobacteria bacterium]